MEREKKAREAEEERIRKENEEKLRKEKEKAEEEVRANFFVIAGLHCKHIVHVVFFNDTLLCPFFYEHDCVCEQFCT